MFYSYIMESNNLFVILLSAIALGISAGIMGAVYRHILSDEPVLHWWFRFGQRFENTWFFKPVWGCHRCISGQLALWAFLLLRILPAVVTHWGQIWRISTWSVGMFTGGVCLLFGLVLAICAAVGTAEFVAKGINYKK